ncbi:hypothetical protein Wcon_00475 [Wolbachia endosymbiont of Cylisticus convexus]|nr:hypothetical protein Wcon_00475 [Wolbachia endosymbiont of Cylisticus convexus]
MKGKAKYTKKKGAVNAIHAIHQKVDKAIVEQDIGNDKWTDKIKKQRLSMESHEHLH